jgi:hypothetical protein
LPNLSKLVPAKVSKNGETLIPIGVPAFANPQSDKRGLSSLTSVA